MSQSYRYRMRVYVLACEEESSLRGERRVRTAVDFCRTEWSSQPCALAVPALKKAVERVAVRCGADLSGRAAGERFVLMDSFFERS